MSSEDGQRRRLSMLMLSRSVRAQTPVHVHLPLSRSKHPRSTSSYFIPVRYRYSRKILQYSVLSLKAGLSRASQSPRRRLRRCQCREMFELGWMKTRKRDSLLAGPKSSSRLLFLLIHGSVEPGRPWELEIHIIIPPGIAERVRRNPESRSRVADGQTEPGGGSHALETHGGEPAAPHSLEPLDLRLDGARPFEPRDLRPGADIEGRPIQSVTARDGGLSPRKSRDGKAGPKDAGGRQAGPIFVGVMTGHPSHGWDAALALWSDSDASGGGGGYLLDGRGVRPSRVVRRGKVRAECRHSSGSVRSIDWDSYALQVNRLNQLYITSIDRELVRLNRKRARLDRVLQYEVLDRLMRAIDAEAIEQYPTSEEIRTLKSANFNWSNVTHNWLLRRSGHQVPPRRPRCARPRDDGARGRPCRTSMSRVRERTRHQRRHPRPSVAHAKVLIATMAAASPEPDVDWLHAVIARADAFASEGEWAERDDLDTHIAELQADKAGLERLLDCESERWLCALFCSLIEYSDSTQRVTPAGDTGRPCVDVPDSPPILCRFSATKPEAHPAK
ncbi:hypothetical protein B0H17DRAFT_1183222 [Mycena rosella]|uniref:Uncharacterized protein n=1 Tax=Mycena rosella TaxID=1033263 RepID=A0AAD7D0S3_MYCRO|nr:hypothetical protein B0H17DRAFT_1183222 [Mycena rosella]